MSDDPQLSPYLAALLKRIADAKEEAKNRPPLTPAEMRADFLRFWDPIASAPPSAKWDQLFQFGHDFYLNWHFGGNAVCVSLAPWRRDPDVMCAQMIARLPYLDMARRIIALAVADGRNELTLAEHEQVMFNVDWAVQFDDKWAEYILSTDNIRDGANPTVCTLDALRQLHLFPSHSEVGEKVYFQTDGEFIKIGRTIRDERKRRKENQTGNPRTLTTLAVIPNASEAKLHERFKAFRTQGGGKDWHHMAPEIMDFIRAWQLVEAAFP